jgi:hypothetical protein
MPKITVEQAVKALGIDVPVMACRMVGDGAKDQRLELHLYGGRVVFYPENPHPNPLPTAGEGTPPRKPRRARSPKDPHPSPIPALKNSAMAREKAKP